MNRLIIIGNCTKDPEMRTTPQGKNVCTFSVAVNRRGRRSDDSQPETDFFRVSAWNELGENCGKYLTKGKKVGVVGSVSVYPFTNSEGKAAARLEVLASEVEFLSSRSESTDQQSGMAQVDTPTPFDDDERLF